MTVSLHGKILSKAQAPVRGASVWLIGPVEVVGPEAIALHAPVQVAWTRAITGFSGHRWSCWQRFVEGQVQGITWGQFKAQVGEQNPALAADGWIFQKDKTYLLPQNPGAGSSLLSATSSAEGEYAFTDLTTPGDYLLLVQAEGFRSWRETITLTRDELVDITLTASVAEPPVVTTPVVPPDIVQVKNGAFVLQGRPFRFVGANIRGLAHYGDPLLFFGASREGDREEQLKGAQRIGARVVRLFLANRFRSVQVVADRLAATLDMLQALDMYAIISFIDVYNDTWFQVQGDYDTYYNGPHSMLNEDFFRKGYKHGYLAFVKEIVGRFKGHKRVFAWELGNELKAQASNGQVLPELFVAFARDVAREIRALDPFHLITTGIINTGNLGMDGQPDLARQLYGDPNIGFLTVHIYPDDTNSPEIPRADREADLARAVGKPLIIEEIAFRVGDRAAKMRGAMDKWFNQQGAKGLMQWGFVVFGHNNGDGDDRHGMDNFSSGHPKDFKALAQAFLERAQALAS